MCWGLTYSRCIVGSIRQRGRLLLLLCAVKNIKPAELQQPEGVEPGGKVWMEKFSVLFFWQGGAVGEVWLISRKSKELPSLTNTNKNLHSWVKYIYGVCSSQNPDFRQSSFFFSTTELTKPTETSPHLQIQAVSDNPRHSIDQRMIMWPYDCIPQVHGKKTLQDIDNRRLFTVSV